MSEFRITNGKGFHMTMENGYTVSVQWGWGNYIDGGRTMREDPESSPNAECAVWDASGKFTPPAGWDDDVKGWMTPEEVVALLVEVAGWPPC